MSQDHVMLCRALADKDKEFLLENFDGSGVREQEEDDDIDIGSEKWKYKYPKGSTLTWKLISDTDDFLHKRNLIRSFVICFRAIGLRCKLKFRRERDESRETDITIEFTHDMTVFDNRPSVLAQAYLYYPGSRFNGVQQWNDNHFFTAYGDPVNAHRVDPTNYPDPNTTVTLKSQPLIHIAMHETMHTLGFRHDLNERDAVLYPYVKDPSHPHAFIFHERDLWRLIKAYEYRGISGRILAYFLNRRLARHDFR